MVDGRKGGEAAAGPTKRFQRWDIEPELLATAFRMVAYFSVLVVIAMFVIPANVRTAIQEATAIASTTCIRWAGLEVSRQGTLLFLPHSTLAIDWACTAITIVIMYTALLLAYRAPVGLKAMGIGVGAVVIIGANQLRILATAVAASYWPSVLYVAHDYLFQVSMVVVVVVLWIWWLTAVNRTGATNG